MVVVPQFFDRTLHLGVALPESASRGVAGSNRPEKTARSPLPQPDPPRTGWPGRGSRWRQGCAARARWSVARPRKLPDAELFAPPVPGRSRELLRTAGPDRPASVRGSPTTTPAASCSTSRAFSSSRSLPVRRSRRRVATGTASTPRGSLRATPTRTEPTSTPNQTPVGRAGLLELAVVPAHGSLIAGRARRTALRRLSRRPPACPPSDSPPWRPRRPGRAPPPRRDRPGRRGSAPSREPASSPAAARSAASWVDIAERTSSAKSRIAAPRSDSPAPRLAATPCGVSPLGCPGQLAHDQHAEAGAEGQPEQPAHLNGPRDAGRAGRPGPPRSPGCPAACAGWSGRRRRRPPP